MVNYFRWEMGLKGWCPVLYHGGKPQTDSQSKDTREMTPLTEVASVLTLEECIEFFPEPIPPPPPLPEPEEPMIDLIQESAAQSSHQRVFIKNDTIETPDQESPDETGRL